jgi:DNA-directed RNA polymerase subunit RPC12/RpoP
VYLLVSIRNTDTGEVEMSLGIYGDGRSMMGSGIYAEDYSGLFYCSDCDKEFQIDATTDDYGYNAYAECPDCNRVLDKDISSEGGLDDDSAYDAWRDGRDY